MAHILVVDDDPHIVDVICYALGKANHTFSTAKNGQEALDAFSSSNHDLIVLVRRQRGGSTFIRRDIR